jgi:hypothetical protein
MSKMKQIISEMVENILQEGKFDAIDLKNHVNGASRYSHDKNSYGYHDKDLKANISQKAIHGAAKEAGYRYLGKQDDKINGKEVTYHMYEKGAGPFSDHKLTVTTPKNNNAVWNIQHMTVKDNS